MATTHADVPRSTFARQQPGTRYRGSVTAVRSASARCRHLHEAEAELEYLREQNRLLRDAALFFGELSERLNLQLREERARRPLTTDMAGPDALETRHIS